jgi:hypothetical protein
MGELPDARGAELLRARWRDPPGRARPEGTEVHVSRAPFFMMVTVNGLYERGPWEIGWHNVDDELPRAGS